MTALACAAAIFAGPSNAWASQTQLTFMCVGLGAARTYLLDTVGGIYRRAGPAAPIDMMDGAQARLAGSHAISSAVAVADYT